MSGPEIAKWDSSKTYAIKDKVNYKGPIYVALAAHTSSTTPDNSSNWKAVTA
ncbi:hypothetical protein FIBSPDRAFT_969973 [Athelia psychrophila]|uniref:Chitin-binding type-3 domain-containing protein n=1 Tax=Athelia psychrophila TaxID=1759441 RepID=A0A167T131_9AGAM|nr:hypothetical protein FIBSPDRAFT_969973 [Fibularhizoctonia sp. CBS 109695]